MHKQHLVSALLDACQLPCNLLCILLPSLLLLQVGQDVHEGLDLEFAPSNAAPPDSSSGAAQEDGQPQGCGGEEGGSKGGSGGWRQGLDALSGGQRTMVSLALVVAVRHLQCHTACLQQHWPPSSC